MLAIYGMCIDLKVNGTLDSDIKAGYRLSVVKLINEAALLFQECNM